MYVCNTPDVIFHIVPIWLTILFLVVFEPKKFHFLFEPHKKRVWVYVCRCKPLIFWLFAFVDDTWW